MPVLQMHQQYPAYLSLVRFLFFCKDSIRYLRNKDLRKSLCNTDQFCIFLQMKRVRNPITSFCLSIPYTCKMITPQEKAVKGELTAFFQY
ncbi:Uncharacterised protein [uncultured Clostridium sp.]|nr:Uncharacterised protein [uncultured Clostridium sp.]